MKQVFLSASITANAVGTDVTPSVVKQAPFDRLINGICISGATVNTGKLHVLKNNLEVLSVSNGVTRTAGQPIDFVSDLIPVGEFVEGNDQLTFTVDNLTGGALTFYIAFDIDEEQA
jgi:hypothetical protein